MARSRIARKYRPRQPVEIGERFGRLVVIGEAGLRLRADGTARIRWVRVRCDCGTEKDMVPSPLRPGIVVSCGCYKDEAAAARLRVASITHGDCRVKNRAPEYGVYRTMISRCYNPNVERYPQYGGRGIEVCERWRGKGGYENFLADIGRRPPGLSIERQDRDGNYDPGNCVWADSRTQANNRVSNHVIEYNGVSKTLAEWAREKGDITPLGIHWRLKNGWSVERALTAPKIGRGGRKKAAKHPL